MIHLIIGGARSGKSSHAERLALKVSSYPAYIATAEPFDEEMRTRIRKHQENRQDRFFTIEEPIELALALKKATEDYSSILVDCLTVWLGNIQYHQVMDKQIELLLDELRSFPRDNDLFLVSNELGQGLVPESALSREFRDRAGFLNQDIAQIADKVTYLIAGIPMEIKK